MVWTAMRFLVPLLLLAACDRGKEAAPVPSGPAAKGSLVFSPRSAAEADVFLATESEVLKSGPIRHQAADHFRAPELAAEDITVRRRPGTTILDVSVRLPDLELAAMRCNQLMQVYFEYRMSLPLKALNDEAMALYAQLERTPDNAAIKQKLLDLEGKRTEIKNDVRVLEPCRPPGARSSPDGAR
jgi:hypothetical protein